MIYKLNLLKFPILTNVYSISRNTLWTISERENLLIAITSGKCSITYDNKEYILNEGDVFFIPKGCAYTRAPIDDILCDMTYLHFSFENICTEYDDVTDIKSTIIEFRRRNEANIIQGNLHSFQNIICLTNHIKPRDKSKTELLEILKDITLHSGINKSFLLSLSLCKILTLLSNEVIYKILSRSDVENVNTFPKKLRQCIDYISQNYSSNITLDELAEHSNISKPQLIRHFKASLSKTPIQYITEFKIAHAKELLFYHSELTINEIALELGFDNQYYFSKVFKKVTGESPSEYRYRTLNYARLHGEE